MIVSPAFAGKRYAVLGLARSGAAVVRSLLASGARVTAWDSDEARREALKPSPLGGRGLGEGVAAGGALGKGALTPTLSPEGERELVLADPLSIDLAGSDGVVVSPGVPLNTHPIAAAAARAGVPVIGDIELFAQARAALPPHKVVGITGTNGKSTTTALVHHILRTAGVPATLGGNIGLPILGQEPLPAGGVYVLELSSFQIDLTFSLDCDVAVLTNITPDHLDRYDGFEAYAASKARLFAMQSAAHVGVTTDDKESANIWDEMFRYTKRTSLWACSTYPEVLGVAVHDGVATIETNVIGHQRDWPTLQGPHNAQNAACAIAACKALGVAPKAIEQGLRTFPGLPHRMERVATRGGVLYVNDSKATNATSAAPALGAYPRIHWILGGRRKTDELDACRPFLPHVAAAYTIGESAELFACLLGREGVPVTNAGTLDVAVGQAAAAARPGDTVLLSPACASFDQFSDYEARGRAFVSAVAALGEAP